MPTMAVALRRLNELDELRELPLTRDNLDAAMKTLTAIVARLAEHQLCFQFGDAAGMAPSQYPLYAVGMTDEELQADREVLVRKMGEPCTSETWYAIRHLVQQIDWQLKFQWGIQPEGELPEWVPLKAGATC